MQYPEILCQLVIRNMAIVEDAPCVVKEIEKVLFNAINEVTEKAVSGLGGWKGCYDLVTEKKEEETTFAPAGWPEDESGVYGAWYTLGHVEPDGGELGWLSSATGLRNTAICFQFGIGNSLIDVTTREKKRLCQEFFSKTPELGNAGFLYKKSGEIYLPFTFDAETLSNEFPDFDEAKATVDRALKTLFKVHPLFDAFVQKIQKKE